MITIPPTVSGFSCFFFFLFLSGAHGVVTCQPCLSVSVILRYFVGLSYYAATSVCFFFILLIFIFLKYIEICKETVLFKLLLLFEFLTIKLKCHPDVLNNVASENFVIQLGHAGNYMYCIGKKFPSVRITLGSSFGISGTST